MVFLSLASSGESLMASEKQIEANRNNSKLSTGPKTQEGKDKVRLNAIKHGLRAKLIEVLPHEDRIEFARRLDAWFEEYDPQSEIEIHRVRQAVILTWKIERADRHEIAQLSKSVVAAVKPCLSDPKTPPDMMNEVFVSAADLASFDAGNAGERLRRYQFALQRALDRTMDQLGEPRTLRDSAADHKTPDLASSTEVVPAQPVVAAGQIQPEPAPVQPEVRTSNAANKAIPLPGTVKLSSALSPKSPTRPIVRGPKPGWVDRGSAGWIDISTDKR